MKKVLSVLCILGMTAVLLGACGSQPESSGSPSGTLPGLPTIGPGTKATTAQQTETEPLETEPPATKPPATAVTETAPPVTQPSGKNGYVICIDAGHQEHANTDKEPLGPGSTEMKTKVSSGTQGRTTGVPEYIVTLQVALKLQAILEERGYEVLMTRTAHDVNISNAERAQMANEANVDAFVRIHCNGVDNSEVNGLLTMCQTRNNPWNGDRYDTYRRLSQCVLDEACRTTGAKNMGIQETDTMTGINWCEVPTTLVEMGFMTNPEEEQKLIDDAYQDLLAEGIANGIDAFLGISR